MQLTNTTHEAEAEAVQSRPGPNTGGTNGHMMWACSEPGTILALWMQDNPKPQ